MKKILLILILVMALAFCSTAFAAGRDVLPTQSIVSPVKAQEMRNEAVNYDSEAILPTGDGNAGEASGQYTYAMLGTMAGMISVTVAFTFLLQRWKKLAAVPSQFISYCVALVALVLVTIGTGNASVSNIILCIFNAVAIMLSANGLYDSIAAKNKTQTSPPEDGAGGSGITTQSGYEEV